MKKQSMFLITIVAFILLLTVGYALYTDTLTIKGTANAFGTFDMQFSEASILEQVGSLEASAIISDDKKSLDINVPKLEYPGAYVLISVKVINKGSIPAMLTDVESVGLDTDPTVKVSYEGLEELKNISLVNNDIQTFNIKIIWDKTSQQSSKDVTFTIKLNYKQAV